MKVQTLLRIFPHEFPESGTPQLVFPQVLALNVTFCAIRTTTAPRVPWQLVLRSRGDMAEASEP